MYGQMTAGSWIYIGTQGILQGTYETFAEAGRQHFGGSLAGTATITAGLGGMGGAQPLAVTMNDGVVICIECDPARIQRRIDHRYLDVRAPSLEDAVRMALARRSIPIGAALLDQRIELSGVFSKGLEEGRGIDAEIEVVLDDTELEHLATGDVEEYLTVRVGDFLGSGPRDHQRRGQDLVGVLLRE